MKNIFCLLLALVAVSCNDILISDDERNGIDDILAFYGGYCQYSIGFSTTTDEDSKKYFELELSQSEVAENYKDKIDMVTSNLAYRFYRNLDEGSKNKYSHIRGKVIFGDGKEDYDDYPVEDLKILNDKFYLITNIQSWINNEDYKQIARNLNDSLVYEYDRNVLATNLEKIDPRFGMISEYRLFGFKFLTPDNIRVLRVKGLFIREKENSQFTIWLNATPESNEILKIDYSW